MKKCLFLLITSLLAATGHTQTFNLVVNNGYGSASYTAGETVHVWSKEIPANSVFDKWTGNIDNLADLDEWHTTLVMPAGNTTIAANFRSVAPYAIKLEQIRGVNNLKDVYYYFPAQYKGVIYFSHGSGGDADNWIDVIENRQMVKDAIADTFAAIITEAEEITLNTDLDGDGKMRWSTFPLDSVANIDMANLKAITDTLIKRGVMTRATPRFAVGMSNGGGFSASLAETFKFKAAVSYCHPTSVSLAPIATVPLQWCMAKYDQHESVGPAGNAQALANHQTLLSRGIPTRHFLFDHSPVYPERFLRVTGISAATSTVLFNGLKNFGALDAKNYMRFNADSLVSLLRANPANFPAYTSLTATQRSGVNNQLDVSFADHQFFSDFNKKTLKFLNDARRGTVTGIENEAGEVELPRKFTLAQNYPNPFWSGATSRFAGNPNTVISFQLPVNSHVTLKVFDVNGRAVATLVDGVVEAGDHVVTFTPRHSASGLFFYRMTVGKFSQTRKAVLMK